MISVGIKHQSYTFKNFRELEILMGEQGYTKDDIDWYEETEI